MMRRQYLRARRGTILYQALYRVYTVRRSLACIKIQTYVRMHMRLASYKQIKSAIISLQCRQRLGMAKKEYAALKREQKDIGKLKQSNERLKLEMASLKAMLAAQAKEDANRQESERDLRERDKEISSLKKRISHLEAELEKSMMKIQKLQYELSTKEAQASKEPDDEKDKRHYHQRDQENAPFPGSPTVSHAGRKDTAHHRVLHDNNQITADNELLTKLQTALEEEREARRAADSEVIKLRAEMNGVKLNPSELDALLPSAKVNLNDILDQMAVGSDQEITKVDEFEDKDVFPLR